MFIRRPIIWGIIVFAVSVVGFVFSVVINVITLGHFRLISNILGYTFILSIPVAIVAELFVWLLRKRKKGKQ